MLRYRYNRNPVYVELVGTTITSCAKAIIVTATRELQRGKSGGYVELVGEAQRFKEDLVSLETVIAKLLLGVAWASEEYPDIDINLVCITVREGRFYFKHE